MEETNYGIKHQGNSRFIFVAPHAAGDDYKTKEISKIIANQLDGSFIINLKYVKPSNKTKTKSMKDFNELSIGKDGKYVFSDDVAGQQMRKFYNDTTDFANYIYEKHKKNPIIVFIHGMSRIEVDIGCGAKYDKKDGKLKGTKDHLQSGRNTGEIMADIEDMEKLKKNLRSSDLKTDIGSGKKDFVACSRLNGIQYFSKNKIGIPVYSFQLEIDSTLRKFLKVKQTSKKIAESLKSTYN